MKKTLALMALCAALAGVTQQAMAVSLTTNYAGDITYTFNTNEDYSKTFADGSNITYTASTGYLAGYNTANSLTISLNKDSESWTSGTHLIYTGATATTGATPSVTASNTACGFIIDGDAGAVRGSWAGNVWTDRNKTEDDATVAKDSLTDSVTVTFNTSNGVTMTSSSNEQLYRAEWLRATGTETTKTYLNSSLITSATLIDKGAITGYTFTNADETWSKTVSSLDDVYNVTKGETKFVYSTEVADKDIVIGSSGLLYLSSNETPTVAEGETAPNTSISISNNIYLGKSTNAYDSIHFGNNKNAETTTTLSGNIYVIEDAAISARGTYAVNITGKVTDKNVPESTDTDGGYAFTVKGKGYTFSNEVSVDTLKLANYGNNTASATFTDTVSVNKLVLNNGAAMTVTGTTTEGETTTSKLSAGSIEFGSGATLNVTGSLTLDANSISIISGTTFSSAEAQTLVSLTGGTLSMSNVDTWTAGTYTINGDEYTTSLSATDSLLKLVFKATSMDLVVGSAELSDNMLTLNVDADLTNVTKVDLTLSEDALADIAGKGGLVGITVAGLDGSEIVGNGVDNVTFYNGAYAGEGNSQYQIAYIPEPTTATLSLLALAGLAARRRRK